MTTITKSKGVQSPLPALPQLDMLSITQSMLNSKHLKPKGIGSHLFERLLMTDSARQAQGPCNLEHETEQTIKWIDKELVLFDCGHIIDDLNEDRSLIDDPAGLINKRDCLKALRTWLVKHYASK